MTILKICLVKAAAVVLILVGLPLALGLPQPHEPLSIPVQYGLRILGWCLLGGGFALLSYGPKKLSEDSPTNSNKPN